MKANDTSWRDGIHAVATEAAGVLDVSIIDSLTQADLVVDAFLGNPKAAALLRAVREAADHVRQAPRRTPALCVCCPRPVKRVRPSTVFGVALPAIPKPGRALGFVFCERCAAEPITLAAKAAEGLRRIWPDLRPITITDPAGSRA